MNILQKYTLNVLVTHHNESQKKIHLKKLTLIKRESQLDENV